MDRVVLMYEEYFSMLQDVNKRKGFYEIHEERDSLDWLVKYRPTSTTESVTLKKYKYKQVTVGNETIPVVSLE